MWRADICALIDSNGEVVVEYKYDAWGDHNIILSEPSYENLAKANPFRYRGYYYDEGIGLYYLKSRYYDPEVGRFITIDDISYIDPETINGLNLYAYCGNNPVMRVDENGTSFWDWLAIGLAVVVATIAGIAATVLSFGAASPLVGLGLAALGGGLLGFSGAVVSNVVSQVQLVGWGNVDINQAWKAGGVGFAIGMISGAISFGAGQIALGIGKGVGFALSKMVVAGVEVSKVFSTTALMTIFGKGFEIVASIAFSFAGDYWGAKLFNKGFSKASAIDSRDSIIFGGLIEFITWLSKIK